MSNFQFVDEFAKKHKKKWKNIIDGEAKTNDVLQKIEVAFSKSPVPIFSSDVDLVVFGSIARNEFSKNSDIDWTILIDGQTRPEHYTFGPIIKDILLSTGVKEPGTTGMFGQLTFAHDLIHYIGGEDDTNHNTSRRILMLLESDNIALSAGTSKSGTAYDRVLKGIINQYISHDSGFRSDRRTNVPRFLLNDVIRFWRTMCVDFAYKQKEQQGKRWALRNIKLRMSRKLIYIKGFLMCFSCYNNVEIKSIDDVKNHLNDLAIMKPLDVVIKVCTENKIQENDIVEMFTAYDKFLKILKNNKLRKHLSKLDMLDVYDDIDFIETRKIADTFQAAIDNIFIHKESKLKEFTLKYGFF